MRIRVQFSLLCATAGVLLGAGFLVPAPAQASPPLIATGISFADRPAYVAVAVEFQGGAVAEGQVEATDPRPFDGIAAVRVFRPGVVTTAPGRSGFGATVRIVQGAGEVTVKLAAAPQRFKYLSYTVASAHRLVIGLWKSAPPSRAAEILRGPAGCLTLTDVGVSPGTVTATGRRPAQPENRFAVIVRGSDGTILGRVVKTRTGAWTARVSYRTPRAQPGTLEASAASLKDGALACLVQRRVWLAASTGGVIRPWRWGIEYLGFWRVGGRGNGTFPAAVTALGRPASVQRPGRGTCVADWRSLGLRIRFTTFGAATGCSSLFAQEGTITGAAGRSRWRTTRGLRVGDPLSRLDCLYPHAIRKPGARIIEWVRPSPYGGGRLDVITASISRGRVGSLDLFIGAAGD